MAVLEHDELAEPLLPRSEPDTYCGDQTPSPDGSEAEEGVPTNDSSPASDEDDDENEAPERGDNEESANALSLRPNPYKNPNVILSFILCIVCGIADSIWGSVILSAFLLAYVMLQVLGARVDSALLLPNDLCSLAFAADNGDVHKTDWQNLWAMNPKPIRWSDPPRPYRA
jgi:hypothetical protein